MMVVLVILLVFFSGYVKLAGGKRAQRGSDPRLTPHEKRILLVLGAVVVVGIGIVIWQRIAA